MAVPRIVYEQLCRIYGESLVSRFYTPISVIRR